MNLAAAAAWIRFIAILGFVSIGLAGLAGLVILAAGLPSSPVGGRFLGLAYLVIAGIYLIPLLPLYRAAGAAARLKTFPSLPTAVEALRNQTVFWRRLGILAIVGIGLSFVFLFIGMIAWAVAR